jgi:hypothetical protein
MAIYRSREEADRAAVCTSVCTPLDETELQAAIDRLTRALATADDEAIPELVAERRALREELHGLREAPGDVVGIADERAWRERGR